MCRTTHLPDCGTEGLWHGAGEYNVPDKNCYNRFCSVGYKTLAPVNSVFHLEDLSKVFMFLHFVLCLVIFFFFFGIKEVISFN